MYLGLIPNGQAERESFEAGRIPAPFFGTHCGFGPARSVIVATKLGVFESVYDGAGTPAEIAERCGTDPAATQKLLIALAGSGYLDCAGGLYSMTAKARTWLVRTSSRSVTDALMFAFCECELMCHIEDYVRTGIPIDLHERMNCEQWSLYQRSMRLGRIGLRGRAADTRADRRGRRDRCRRLARLLLGGAVPAAFRSRRPPIRRDVSEKEL